MRIITWTALLAWTIIACNHKNNNRLYKIYICRSDSSYIDYLGELNSPASVHIISKNTKVIYAPAIDTLLRIYMLCDKEKIQAAANFYKAVIRHDYSKNKILRKCMEDNLDFKSSYTTTKYPFIESNNKANKVIHLLIDYPDTMLYNKLKDTFIYKTPYKCYICYYVSHVNYMGNEHAELKEILYRDTK